HRTRMPPASASDRDSRRFIGAGRGLFAQASAARTARPLISAGLRSYSRRCEEFLPSDERRAMEFPRCGRCFLNIVTPQQCEVANQLLVRTKEREGTPEPRLSSFC